MNYWAVMMTEESEKPAIAKVLAWVPPTTTAPIVGETRIQAIVGAGTSRDWFRPWLTELGDRCFIFYASDIECLPTIEDSGLWSLSAFKAWRKGRLATIHCQSGTEAHDATDAGGSEEER
jgi:hypothetical protein